MNPTSPPSETSLRNCYISLIHTQPTLAKLFVTFPYSPNLGPEANLKMESILLFISRFWFDFQAKINRGGAVWIIKKRSSQVSPVFGVQNLINQSVCLADSRLIRIYWLIIRKKCRINTQNMQGVIWKTSVLFNYSIILIITIIKNMHVATRKSRYFYYSF